MGTACNAPATACVDATNITASATCDSSLTTFALPSLGRLAGTGPHAGGPSADAGASWAASEYPGASSNVIQLDGTSSDSLHFAPTTPAPGVAAL